MKIAIICSPGVDFEIIDQQIENWMNANDIWLFSVCCGDPDSAGAKWASRRGAPIIYESFWNADFIFLFDMCVDYEIRNLLSRIKQIGKHGAYFKLEWK